jgi:hypothetical protein
MESYQRCRLADSDGPLHQCILRLHLNFQHVRHHSLSSSYVELLLMKHILLIWVHLRFLLLQRPVTLVFVLVR